MNKPNRRALKAVPAENPILSLIHLLNSADPEALIAIVDFKRAHPLVLSALAYHPDPRVRAAVGDDPRTPQSILLKLAHDQSTDLRYQLAENHHLPVSVLCVLAHDSNPYIEARAAATLARLGRYCGEEAC